MLGSVLASELIGFSDLSGPLLVFLFVFSFVGGVVTSSMGPGGILFIVAMYLLSPLTSAQIAGTSAGIFFTGSAVGTLSYAQSDDIEYALAIVLSVASVVGVRGGVWLNRHVSEDLFGLVLAGIVILVGANILYREYYGLAPVHSLDPDSLGGMVIVAVLGLAIGCIGGLTGIGGAALSVPALVLLGIPFVPAVAAGIVQGLFVTATTAVSYTIAGETVWPLVVTFAVPFAVGIVVGWQVAHSVDSRVLKVTLGCLLILLAGGIVVI
jgi:uncharacterized membrane protein YfcA